MNFMNVTGQFIQASGLLEIYIKGGLLGQKSGENALARKTYG